MTRSSLALSLAALGVAANCGKSVDVHPGAKCGPGTVEVDGECIVDSGGAAGSGGAGGEAVEVPEGGRDVGSGGVDDGSGGAETNVAGQEATAGAGGAFDAFDADPANCGASGYECVGGRTCENGRCIPAWLPMTTTGAPANARTRHAAGFVDGRYVVFGGALQPTGIALVSTSTYDPVEDSWQQVTSLGTERCAHEAVSTGTTILTFGGLKNCGDGAATGPGLESFTLAGGWQQLFIAAEPPARYNFASTWTGEALFVYGGGSATGPATASGAFFTPAPPGWSDATCALVGCERGGYFSAFNDGDLIRIWGGGPFGSAPAGLTFSPDDGWSNWELPPGSAEMLAQRFVDDGQRLYYLKATDRVTIYDKASNVWTEDDAEMPAGFCIEAAAAWSGHELIAWSGYCDGAVSHVGARYQPPARRDL